VAIIWIVNLPDQQVEVYQANGQAPRVYLRDDQLEVDSVAVDLATLFEGLEGAAREG